MTISITRNGKKRRNQILNAVLSSEVINDGNSVENGMSSLFS
jgi:hypothetical protein